MKQYLLLTSALVASGLLNSGVAEAACIKTPTCSSLGYESTTSCSGGLKCPFGNAWNCNFINKINSITTQITNLTTRVTTLEEKIVTIENSASSSNCVTGDILYSDKTCSVNVVSGKTPIGVVFDFDKTNKLAIGLEESDEIWSRGIYVDVPGLSNIESSSKAIRDWQGKNNTKVVLEYYKANGENCPAFEYVNSYKTEGTQAGDWYLPSMGELNAIYIYKDLLNITLGKIGGTKLGASTYWSSTEYSDASAWYLYFNDGKMQHYSKFDKYLVRPVLAF